MSQPAVVSAADEKHVEYTIDLLNGRLADGTIAPDDIIKLYKLCMSRKKKAIANLCVVTGMFLSANAGLSFHQTLEVALCGEYRGLSFNIAIQISVMDSISLLVERRLHVKRALPN